MSKMFFEVGYKDSISNESTWPDNNSYKNVTQRVRLRSADETRSNLAATRE